MYVSWFLSSFCCDDVKFGVSRLNFRIYATVKNIHVQGTSNQLIKITYSLTRHFEIKNNKSSCRLSDISWNAETRYSSINYCFYCELIYTEIIFDQLFNRYVDLFYFLISICNCICYLKCGLPSLCFHVYGKCDRQKIIVKGKLLTDTKTKLSNYFFPNSQNVLKMN